MKYALITGADRGIGAATARVLAEQGCGVAIHYHTGEAAALALAEELRRAGARVMTVQADVSRRDEVERMVDNVLGNFCQLDILICNAGVSHVGLFGEIDDADWRRLFAVNVDGVYHCCQAVLPHFIHRKAGSIVTVSSMWGQVGASCEAAYSATKGAVIALTKALAKELGPSGIRVNCVAPGTIDTDMNRHLTPEDLAALAEETPLGRIGAPEEAARAIAYLALDGASYITGQVLAPNGGFVI